MPTDNKPIRPDPTRTIFLYAQLFVVFVLLVIGLVVMRGCGLGAHKGGDSGSAPPNQCSTENAVRKASCPAGTVGPSDPLQICKNGQWTYSYPPDGDLTKFCKASSCTQQVFTGGVQQLLTAKCVSCHPGYDKFSLAKTKADAFIAQTADNRMPKDNAPLSADEKALFTNWKKDGLLENCPTDTATNIPFQSLNDLELSLTKDIQTQSPGLQTETRWLVLHNLTNEGTNAKQFATFQKAIQKGINIISSGRAIVTAAAADQFGTALRFNLNDLKLTNAAWVLIENADPINLESFSNLGLSLKAITATRKPWLFASAAAIAMNTSSVYNAVHKIPADLNTFLGQLGVNQNTQIANFQALQVGFANSPISLNKNRLMARFDSNDGALWQTFDTNGTVSADRNFFNFPLLKSASGKATAKFDASELLFNLPNGLFGSALFDAAGKRLDAAALNVVAHNINPPADPTIKNAQSCHRCHAPGLIPRKDEINASVQANAAQFDLRDVDLVTQLFRDPAQNFTNDNLLMGAALSKLGILTTDADPISATIDNLSERTLNAKAVASILLLTEDQFKAGLNQSAQGKAQVGQLLTGGSITFQQLQASLPILFRDLRIGQNPLSQ